MRLELTETFIKDLEKRCKRYIAPSFVFQVDKIELDLDCGLFWTMTVSWGSPDGKTWYKEDICFEDRDYSFDFVCGMISQLVFMKESGKCL